MLHELRIENLLLIERAELRLGPGLNAITGETGAGKTVLAHAIDLLTGGKAREGIVRPGASEAYVEGAFDLPEDLRADPELAELADRVPEDAQELVLARRVSAGGRTSAFVQGRMATASDLATLGARLLSFYGQHQHRRLTLASAQADVLDGFGGAEQLELRRLYGDAHRTVRAAEQELESLLDREGARERELDLLRFELDEIEALAPDPERAAELAAERDRLRSVDALREAASIALGGLSGDEDGAAGGAVSAGAAALDPVAASDSDLEGLAQRLAALDIEIGEITGELHGYLDRLEADPERLEEIEGGLAAIDRLTRKHGGSVEAVLDHAERCRSQIAELEDADGRADRLERALASARSERDGVAAQLSAARARSASSLESASAAELECLAMADARLEVTLEPYPEGHGPGGAERVELRVSTNPGMPLAPLRDAASGGELSRVMLALCSLATAGGAATLVFDEIDAGVGGTTANAVGERLRALSAGRQVLCITHLPQVASQAEAHFRIAKHRHEETATTAVQAIEGEELVAEICRMMGSEATDETASRHARELLAA